MTTMGSLWLTQLCIDVSVRAQERAVKLSTIAILRARLVKLQSRREVGRSSTCRFLSDMAQAGANESCILTTSVYIANVTALSSLAYTSMLQTDSL